MEMGITDTITPVNGLSKHRILLKTNLVSEEDNHVKNEYQIAEFHKSQ